MVRRPSIPAGCQTEDTVTLKGLGVTNIRNKDERGNLIAHVKNVLIPTKLNENRAWPHRTVRRLRTIQAPRNLPGIPSTGRSKERFLQQVEECALELRTGLENGRFALGVGLSGFFVLTGRNGF